MVDGPPQGQRRTGHQVRVDRIAVVAHQQLAVGLPAAGPHHHLRLGEFGDHLLPKPDGSLTGTFATNIGEGACAGTVYILLTAVPADPGSTA